MESFSNFLKSLTDTLNITQVNTDNSELDRRNSNVSESSGYATDDSDINAVNNTRRSNLNAIRNQAREDDDEEFEARGRGRGQNLPGGNNTRVTTGAVVGLAALAIGGYVIGKTYFSKDKKLSETKEEIVEKIKEIEEDAKEYPVIGFDCQWSQTFEGTRRNKIAVLQIASHTGKVLLIQINKLYTFPEELKQLLKNRNIIKSGIEVLKDARYLLEDYGLVVTGTFDLRFLAEETSHRPESLAKLANKILGMELNRDWELIASEWSKETLDENQINYAEMAVKASIDIFKKLIPFALEDDVNRSEILNYCSEYLDRTYIFYSQNY